MTETASVRSEQALRLVRYKVIERDISRGHFSKLEMFVVRPLMGIEDRNCTLEEKVLD